MADPAAEGGHGRCYVALDQGKLSRDFRPGAVAVVGRVAWRHAKRRVAVRLSGGLGMQDLAEARLRNDPFAASYLGVSGYDDAVPDLSPQAQRAWRDRLVDVVARCEQLEADVENLDSRVLLAAVRDDATRGLALADSRVHDVIEQLRDYLAHQARDPLVGHRPPQGWDGAAAWREELERVVRDEVRPARGLYLDLLVELLPRSRPSERAGLLHVPGGRAQGARSAGEVMSRLRQDASLQA